MKELRAGPISKHPLYGTWNGMKQRCLNPNNDAYADYGGRGIKIHEPWREDFWAFAEYVGQLPGCGEPGRSIDRYPDVNGNYEPGNVRWATDFEQMQNTRSQLDPMNGIHRDHGMSTWYYHVTRNGVLYAEYGFAGPEEAAAARNHVQAMIDAGAGEDALTYIQRKKDERAEALRSEREAAEQRAAEAKRALDEARAAKKLARELERQARKDDKTAKKAGRAARWHELNKTMTLAEIARQEGVSVAHVSLRLKAAELPVALHNSTGFPGVKKVTKGKRTYYVARMVIDGQRKDLGQRKTPEEAYALIVAAREQAQPEPARPKRRSVQVRAA